MDHERLKSALELLWDIPGEWTCGELMSRYPSFIDALADVLHAAGYRFPRVFSWVHEIASWAVTAERDRKYYHIYRAMDHLPAMDSEPLSEEEFRRRIVRLLITFAERPVPGQDLREAHRRTAYFSALVRRLDHLKLWDSSLEETQALIRDMRWGRVTKDGMDRIEGQLNG